MLNEKDYVSFDTAKMLKNKGFDEFCRYTYMENENSVGITVSTNSKLPKGIYSMPTLYQAQKWLRERYNIHITIGNSASGYWWEASKADNGTTLYDYNYSGPNDGGKWDTYEECLNCGILKVLSLI